MRITLYSLIALILISLGSCSKETLNSAEKDIVKNVIRTGKWNRLTKTVTTGDAPGVSTELLTDGAYLEFKSDNRAWIYQPGGVASSVPYNVVDTRVMEYDGLSYRIQENIIGKISTMTLRHESEGTRTELVFKRND